LDCGLDWLGLGWGPLAGWYKHSNELTGSAIGLLAEGQLTVKHFAWCFHSTHENILTHRL